MNGTGATRSKRFESLDLWRGLLCLYIVIEHSSVMLWRGVGEAHGFEGLLRGWLVFPLTLNIGTPLFFVISGYCVLSSIDSHRRRNVGAPSFICRRFTRIFPSYWAALLGFMVVVGGLDALGLHGWHKNGLTHELASPSELTPAQWVGNLTLTETWRPHVAGEREHVFTRIAWSLCYQEQFYVVCFLVLLVFRRHFHKVLAGLTALILAFMVFAYDVGLHDEVMGFFPVRWHHFAAGLATYWYLNNTCAKVRAGLLAALLGLVGVSVVNGDAQSIAAGMFALALIGTARWDARLAGMRWAAPLKACGLRSYSIYLIHLPIALIAINTLDVWGLQEFWTQALVVVPLAVASVLAASWVFHEWVDTPMANATKARGRAPARLVTSFS